eukprot:scaffold18037_cov60-Attheya_sp.AAC.1
MVVLTSIVPATSSFVDWQQGRMLHVSIRIVRVTAISAQRQGGMLAMMVMDLISAVVELGDLVLESVGLLVALGGGQSVNAVAYGDGSALWDQLRVRRGGRTVDFKLGCPFHQPGYPLGLCFPAVPSTSSYPCACHTMCLFSPPAVQTTTAANYVPVDPNTCLSL